MLADVAPALRDAFISGMASVHDADALPAEFRGLPNGHEGSHHFLVDDFVTAINTGTLPPVNAWEAARYTLPGHRCPPVRPARRRTAAGARLRRRPRRAAPPGTPRIRQVKRR